MIIKEKLPSIFVNIAFLEHLLTNKKTITEAITQSYAQTNKEIINSGLDIDLRYDFNQWIYVRGIAS